MQCVFLQIQAPPGHIVRDCHINCTLSSVQETISEEAAHLADITASIGLCQLEPGQKAEPVSLNGILQIYLESQAQCS